MDIETLVRAATQADAVRPAGLAPAVAALWHLRRGEWEAAHACVQDDAGADAAWVHALVHRIEGDLGNARYWYGRAGRSECTDTTDAEWRHIAGALLGDHAGGCAD